MAKKQSKKQRSPWIRRSIIIAACLLAGIAVFFGYRLFGPNTKAFSDDKYFYVRTGSTYSDVLSGLEEQGIIRSRQGFDWVARGMDYPSRVKPGRYKVHRGMSNFELARMLRAGRQAPVKLVIRKLRTQNDFVRLVARNLEADSTALRALLNDDVYLRQYNLTPTTAMAAVMPDTYEFYWNTSASKVFDKLATEYKTFWTPSRKEKAASFDLSPVDVTILASIVDEETNATDEKPTIASVYYNRLRKGMLLQADPTVKFALQDFTLRRIRIVHTQHDSPYNTYKYKGLPPGPICTPSEKSLDAVLNMQNTNYLYFCARLDKPGYHAFAATYSEHLLNAKKYQRRMDELGL
ncbi:endolytic transglycosylase MltG [Chitinophaga horti]|uniref:Endolytic murein transglycosylase n=1 Tax=Chitinophaga horti TaxID=2920382 RepID=A0ABY6IYU3_9BACT|nr:endolytic transglycosylase MltG [Chitinophaga horti]UYQ91082.1 endolytic transglycosylase MltG [Chitinophaga horti]